MRNSALNLEANNNLYSRRMYGLLAGGLMLATSAFTGCQIDVAGQTLPSPYYLTDDVQYFAPGPEFKLAREAAAMKEQSEANTSGRQKNCCN